MSELNGTEARTPLRPFTTASNSSGDIKVYFNQSTNPDFSNGTFPAASSFDDTEDAIKARIDAAEETVDVMMYNTSRDWLVDALEDAVDRGVRVRYIADDQTTNSALSGSIDFPVLEGNDGNALMHNKVFIIDAASVDNSYLIMGSMNMTYNNVITDPNNTVFVQDQAIAKAYTWEFNEMWGGDTELPNLTLSRFGDQKTHNTPIYFNVAGTPVELYFAPTDPTSDAILENLASADEEVILGLLLLTQNRIGDLLVDLHDAGIRIRGLIENIDDPGSEFFYLQNEGVNLQAHNVQTQFHHKYAIVDPDELDSDPLVITGSYNWTNAAENRNDENTLVIHDADIANQFVQEFEERWGEATSTQELVQPSIHWSVFPNPSSGFFQFNKEGNPFDGLAIVFDAQGRLMQSIRLNNVESWTLDAQGWEPGLYY
ncbi:MAG: phospholipase D-like domain-containing protein, partial [Bacteroidota bacterium]